MTAAPLLHHDTGILRATAALLTRAPRSNYWPGAALGRATQEITSGRVKVVTGGAVVHLTARELLAGCIMAEGGAFRFLHPSHVLPHRPSLPGLKRSVTVSRRNLTVTVSSCNIWNIGSCFISCYKQEMTRERAFLHFQSGMSSHYIPVFLSDCSEFLFLGSRFLWFRLNRSGRCCRLEMET